MSLTLNIHVNPRILFFLKDDLCLSFVPKGTKVLAHAMHALQPKDPGTHNAFRKYNILGFTY